VHIKSPHQNALPLLLLPSFPLTNLSLIPLLNPLTNPENPSENQPFHVIAPSIPGLGFSDGFTAPPAPDSSVLENTAHLFNALMVKLGYEHYIASSTGSGSSSPANIDYHLPRVLAKNHSENCLGIHLINPPLQEPTFSSSPLAWTKYAFAKFFHAPIFGYSATDWKALTNTLPAPPAQTHLSTPSQDLESGLSSLISPATAVPIARPPLKRAHSSGFSNHSSSISNIPTFGSLGLLGLREPNTLAYALCDSPVGLLSLVLNGLRRASPTHRLSKTEIIDFTQLAWLPGPEGAMRFWCLSATEADAAKAKSKNTSRKWEGTRAAVTVFFSEGINLKTGEGDDADGDGYKCPAWSETRHQVIWAKRQTGRAGLAAWERTECVVEGIRGLAKELGKLDARFLPTPATEVLTTVIVGDTIAEVDEEGDGVLVGHSHGEGGDGGMQLDVASPDTIVASPAGVTIVP
jgi:hypothetical protein